MAEDHKSRLSGDDLREMFVAATALLERNVEAVNALNVFPVPDGDTGTNMFLTLRAVVDSVEPLSGAPASDVAREMARGALMGARGNSGVILSQFFKGIAVGLDGATDFGAQEMAAAYASARDLAYRAVGEPVEGTILTVMSSVADAARSVVDAGGGVHDLGRAAHEAAVDSVARTPTMLQVLRDAGVVDAGGQGLAVMLAGVRGFITGDADLEEIAPPEPVGVQGATGAISTGFLESVEENEYGYCIQLLLEGTSLDVDEIRGQMAAIAVSPVVVGDHAMVKVHVHSDDPGPVVSLAVSKGTLTDVNIRNMDTQHAEFSAELLDMTHHAAATAMVAVALGAGMEAVFRNLGVSELVSGGDTMNPSVQDLKIAVERANADGVILLPNNRNIVPAARQAAESSSKTIHVVPTTSVPQGIAAALVFSGELGAEDNAREMQEAAEALQTGEVTTAVRSASVNGIKVDAGQLMGLLEHRVVRAGGGLSDVLEAILRDAQVSKGDLVTLYSGEPVTPEDCSSVIEALTDAFPGVELELVAGGQPHYHFMVSIE
jgi:hypothetical protein